MTTVTTKKTKRKRSVVKLKNDGEVGVSKRINASRENGKKGGVKTTEGKVISSINAIKHGVLSNALSEYDKLSSGKLYIQLSKEFEVKTVYQKMLLEQLVLCYIKLARCSRFESDIMKEALSTTENPNYLNLDFGTDEEEYIPKSAKALIGEQTFKRMELVLLRYEPQLVNRLMGIMRVLRNYQKENKQV